MWKDWNLTEPVEPKCCSEGKQFERGELREVWFGELLSHGLESQGNQSQVILTSKIGIGIKHEVGIGVYPNTHVDTDPSP